MLWEDFLMLVWFHLMREFWFLCRLYSLTLSWLLLCHRGKVYLWLIRIHWRKIILVLLFHCLIYVRALLFWFRQYKVLFDLIFISRHLIYRSSLRFIWLPQRLNFQNPCIFPIRFNRFGNQANQKSWFLSHLRNNRAFLLELPLDLKRMKEIYSTVSLEAFLRIFKGDSSTIHHENEAVCLIEPCEGQHHSPIPKCANLTFKDQTFLKTSSWHLVWKDQ